MTAPQPTTTRPAGPVHRVSWPVVVLGIAGVLAIGAVIGILLALGNHETKPPPLPSVKSAGLQDVQAPSKASTAAAGVALDPANRYISITPPRGWGSRVSSHAIDLVPPDSAGLLVLESGFVSSSLVGYVNNILSAIQHDPAVQNPKLCAKPTGAPLPNAPRGVLVIVCYTFVPQNGQAFRAIEYVVATVARGRGGTVGVAVHLTSDTGAIKHFLNEAIPVAGRVRWKLL